MGLGGGSCTDEAGGIAEAKRLEDSADIWSGEENCWADVEDCAHTTLESRKVVPITAANLPRMTNP